MESNIPPKHIAIFISGGGSNAAAIMRYFQGNPTAKVALVLSNNPQAGGLQVAELEGIPAVSVTKEDFNNPRYLLPLLEQYHIDLIVLAGFLWLVPAFLVNAYDGKMVNIHPALLPKFGGKGMYGRKVHEAVMAAGEKETGITIHYVNPHYDEGQILHQATCPVSVDDTPQTLARKVLQLEHEWYPRIIEKVLSLNK